jgi:hypothetical protein
MSEETEAVMCTVNDTEKEKRGSAGSGAEASDCQRALKDRIPSVKGRLTEVWRRGYPVA